MEQAEVALWIQVAAVLTAVAAAIIAMFAAVAASVVALVLGWLDRRTALAISTADQQFQRLFREQGLLQRLLANYNRGGSTDSGEAQRMGSEALTLIGAIGPERLPELKADMMNRPERWVSVTVQQVRAKCRELGMRSNDVDTIADYLQRRKEGRRFNVRSSYRDFRFN